MPGRVALFLIILLLGSCTGKLYQQQDARIYDTSGLELPPAKPGEVWVRANPKYQRHFLHRLLWGKHYRQVWAAPVLIPVLDLEKFPHQLQPKKMGGGLQTTSLSLTDTLGRTFTLRTLDKNPTKSLTSKWQKLLVSSIMRDQTSAINPYASFTMPPLAEAVGVFHTNPKPYYVPVKAEFLGEYSKDFSGKLTMLEEKFENLEDITATFGPVAEVIDSEKLFERLDKGPDHQVDQSAMARARLLDVILGDWDRHEGQWTWAKYKENKQWVYKPIPKDRDYVYYRYDDGIITWLLSRRILAGKIKPFIHNIPDLEGIIYKGRKLDRQMLNKLSADEWEAIAKEMQAALTDKVLQSAVQKFPESVYKLEGEKTYKYLSRNVEQLPKTAENYYRHLAREVKIRGTDEKEKVVITNRPDKTTSVQIYTLPTKASEAPQLIYNRLFRATETKEIALNALGGADEYILEGNFRRGPNIKIHFQKNQDVIRGKTESKKIKIKESKNKDVKENIKA
jgi:hypothetical protein